MPPKVPHKEIAGIPHKRCCRCKEWKQLSDFYKRAQAWDKLLARCKDCDRDRVKNWSKKTENKKRRQSYDSEYNRSKAGRNTSTKKKTKKR